MADRPDFAAIARHRAATRPLGDSITDTFLDQVVAYALDLERERDDLRARNRQAETLCAELLARLTSTTEPPTP